jgi:hypothetical protein
MSFERAAPIIASDACQGTISRAEEADDYFFSNPDREDERADVLQAAKDSFWNSMAPPMRSCRDSVGGNERKRLGLLKQFDVMQAKVEAEVRLYAKTTSQLRSAEGSAKPVGEGLFLRLGGIVAILALAVIFALVLIPTLELLMFTDELTGEVMQGGTQKAALAGWFLGAVLGGVTFFVAHFPLLDQTPKNDFSRKMLALLPLLFGFFIVFAITLFRVQQIGWSLPVYGLTLIECVVVGLMELVAHYYNNWFARPKADWGAVIRSCEEERREVEEAGNKRLQGVQDKIDKLNASLTLGRIGGTKTGDDYDKECRAVTDGFVESVFSGRITRPRTET